jgi:hypothetical protein
VVFGGDKWVKSAVQGVVPSENVVGTGWHMQSDGEHVRALSDKSTAE